jgi:Tfp pilus assembly protein PilE
METRTTVYCRHCGSAITVNTLVCPKCGMGQDGSAGKRNNTAVILVIALAVGFVGIAVIGILAAIAIPQFAEYRSRGGDASARAELMNAKVACESYFVDNKHYPESLDQAGFKPAEKVSVNYERDGDENYSITAEHQSGRKVFAATSKDSSKVYVKQKDAPDSEFAPLD